MNRTSTSIASIAFAAAAVFGATASFAAGNMPAAGEFSGVEQVSAPYTAHLRTAERPTYNMAANGQPAAGEFSAADQQLATAPGLSREAVREALAQSREGHTVVNGEIPEALVAAPSALTRQAVRQEGRVALRNHQLDTGDASL